MNINEVIEIDKAVSAKVIFKTNHSNVTAIHLQAEAILKEHITKTPALLTCVQGEVNYNDEQGIEITLIPGDFNKIEPNVKHWLTAHKTSKLILSK